MSAVPDKPDSPRIPKVPDIPRKPVPKVPDMPELPKPSAVPGPDKTVTPIKPRLPQISKIEESPEIPPLPEGSGTNIKVIIPEKPKMEKSLIPKIPSLANDAIPSRETQRVSDFVQRGASAGLADIPQKAIISGSVVRDSPNGIFLNFFIFYSTEIL